MIRPARLGDASHRPSAASSWLMAVLLLGLALFLTNASFPLIDDEVRVFAVATQPAAELVHDYWIGQAPHPHPPLFDLLLHGWLRVTGGDLRLLRLPSILFYVAGLWFLALAAGRLGGESGTRNLVLVGVLWPYGFHFGRLAVWYSLTFFLVALVTHAYLRLLEKPGIARWTVCAGSALALVFSNYFGWALLACLAVDFALEPREKFTRYWRTAATTVLLLMVAYIPLWRAFTAEARGLASGSHSLLSTAAFAGFAGYVLFVSESVAPWFWWLSVPALLAIAVCLGVVTIRGADRLRRFLFNFFVLFIAMAVLGILTTKRAMLLAPWLLLPVAGTLSRIEAKFLRRAAIASLAVAFAIGWFGIASRKYYAAPRFIEPWAQLGQRASRSVEQGALVIGNHPSFFFYLTAATDNPLPDVTPRLRGVLTYSIFHQRVFQPEQWIEAGRPLRPSVFVVQGVTPVAEAEVMQDVEKWLGDRCQLIELTRSVPDPGSPWKQKFFPELGQTTWRIEVRNYSCGGQNGQSPGD